LPATRDITERRKAHQELLDSERRHPLIEGRRRLCDLPARAGGNVATWNPGAERIRGYASSEIIGQHFQSVLYPEDLEREVAKQALAEFPEHGRVEWKAGECEGTARAH
jgi:PAS domain-containing protein